MSSTLEEYRNKVAAIRTERDRFEEECRLKIDPEDLQEMVANCNEDFFEEIHILDFRGLSENEVLSNLFLLAISQMGRLCTLLRADFRDAKAKSFRSGIELLLNISHVLGCRVIEDCFEAIESQDFDQFSGLLDKIVSQIVEAKITQQID